MSSTSDFKYLNTAAAGLVPKSYLKSVSDFLAQLSIDPSQANERWYAEELAGLRALAAEFSHAQPEEVAFIPNFSYALNALVHSLDRESRVMVLYEDYPSVVDPFRLNGFEVQRVKSQHKLHFNTEDIIVELLSRKIQILAISHVQWLTGFKLDLNALGKFCRERGILLIVDATQSMGGMPVSLKQSNADVIIASSYKWLNAGFGTGMLLARRDFLERFPPKIRGNNSRMLVNNDWNDDTAIIGYEPGHLNIPGLILLQQALEDKLHTGIDRIHKNNMDLTRRFIESLSNRATPIAGPESIDQRSSIVLIKGGESLFDYLTREGFVVSLRNNLVRISFHYHNTSQEVDELAHTINKWEKP